MRSDNEQIQSQYQQYNANVQRHVQELNEQVTFYYFGDFGKNTFFLYRF
jgi:hypothetical protein